MKSFKQFKESALSLILVSIMISTLFLGFTAYNFQGNQSYSTDNQIRDDQDAMPFSENGPHSADPAKTDWWNSSYRYRVEVNFTEDGYANRTNEPVNVFVQFDQGECHKDTIRAVYNNTDEIPYQMWNISMYSGDTYIKYATLTFLAEVRKSNTIQYFIYYSDTNENGNILNPKEKYIDQSALSTDFDGTTLSIDTSEFNVKLKEGRGVYNFTNKENSINYHTNNSLSPWIKNGPVDLEHTQPDNDDGWIKDWLVVGPFDYPGGGSNSWPDSTTTDFHIDLNKNFIEGDYATGGTLDSQYLDPSKQWEKLPDSDVHGDGRIDFDGYYDENDYVAAYAQVYLRSPEDLASDEVDLWIGSDDECAVFRDGEKIHVNPNTRDASQDQDKIEDVSFDADRWYRYTIEVTDHTGGWDFYFRFKDEAGNPITNFDIAMNPPVPKITSISEASDSNKVNGPIFSQYRIAWEDSGDMEIRDTITVYDDYNLWKTERKLFWKEHQQNTSFSLLNTFYNNTQNDYLDDYFYDYNYTSSEDLPTPPSAVENYALASDTDSSNSNTTIGIFLSDIKKGSSMEFSSLGWGVSYDENEKVINFSPGNGTDLDNQGSHYDESIENSHYYIKITYWEYIDSLDYKIDNERDKANKTFSGIYDALKNPLAKQKDEKESSFFDLTVEALDHDERPARDVNVTIYNSTYDQAEDKQLTDESGEVSFERLANGTYYLNFSITDETNGEFFVKENVKVILNETKDITVENLNLTSMLLEFSTEDSEDPETISGAQVEFFFINSSGDIDYPIQTLNSDSNGEVNFMWKNISQTTGNISTKVSVLGEEKRIQIKDSGEDPVTRLNFTFQSRRTENVSVRMSSYETFLNRTTPEEVPVNDKFKNEVLDYEVWYHWKNDTGEVFNISDATVNYEVRDSKTEDLKTSGSLDDAGKEGFYNLSLNTSIDDLNAERTYQLTISAQKGGYEAKELTTPFTLKEIWTNLTADETDIKVSWANNFTVRVYYNDTLNDDIGLTGAGVTYNIPGVISGDLIEESTAGWYNLTLNSTDLEETGKYTIYIYAYKENYAIQDTEVDINVTDISTELEINPSKIEEIWGKNISFSVSFNDTTNDCVIPDGEITYDVSGTVNTIAGSFKNVGDGEYNLTLNTTNFLFSGFYNMRVSASKPNYISREIDVPITLSSIPTEINNSKQFQSSPELYIHQPYNFTLEYTDLDGERLSDLDTAYFNWYKLDEEGNELETEGNYGSGNLIESSESLYILDFNTSKREIGYYSIWVYLGKTNYELRFGHLTLAIEKRIFTSADNQEILASDQVKTISVEHGEEIKLEFTLTDDSAGREGNPLENATVTLNIDDGTSYALTETAPGIYEVTIPTEQYDTFFAAKQLVCQLKIEKENYVSQEFIFNVNVAMEKMGPIPLFYLILGAIFGIGVIGALATYRYIQIARIPEFIKRADKAKEQIKKRKDISESVLYPSREELIAEKFNERWEKLGISLSDVLGVERKRGKEISKDKGGAK